MLDLDALAELATGAAQQAGAMISVSRPSEVDHKAGAASLASQVVTDIDRAAEAIIVERLEPTLESLGIALLTEERPDDGRRLVADHFWCIDPLDGTLPFVEGTSGYAVSIALVRRDGRPLVGVVHDPVSKVTWTAVAGRGVECDGAEWRPSSTTPDVLSVFVDRSFLDRHDRAAVLDRFASVAHDLELSGVREQPPAGAVMNAIGVLGAAPACYVKPPKPTGGGSLWDFAATACIVSEAGAVATDIHGAPLDLNRAEATLMNHRGVLFATDSQLAGALRRVFAPEVR